MSRILKLAGIFTTCLVQTGFADTIIIDPGHGGPTAGQWNGDNGDGRGSSGPNGLTEQWVNLEIANLLKNELSDIWTTVRQTRESQTEGVDLVQRVDIANSYVGSDDVVIFVSIHHNGYSGDPDNNIPGNPIANVQGTETLWCEQNSTEDGFGNPVPDSEKKALADAIQPYLVSAFGYNDRGVKEDATAQGHLIVLRDTRVIAELSEASFLDTYAEEDSMAYKPDHRLDEAIAIDIGVTYYAGTIDIDPNYCVIPPGTPTNLSVYALYSNGPMVDWDESDRASFYQLHRSTTSGFSPTTQTLIGSPSSSIYFDEDLYQPEQYYYKVRAVSDCGGPGYD